MFIRFVYVFIVIFSLSYQASLLANTDKGTEEHILATRGQGILTQEQFDAHADRLPAASRKQILRDKSKLKDILDQLLLSNQLAEEAIKAGFDQDPVVQARMELAAREELARAWLVHTVDEQSDADFNLMARESWQLNKDKYMTKPTVDVTHILISNAERTNEDALELAEQLAARIQADPSLFDEMVLEYSEDPSVVTNNGRFTGVEQGQMVKAFEDEAFSLPVGGISAPVKTVYGYHLIRVDAKEAARQRTFEEVEPGLVKRMRRDLAERVERAYLSGFYTDGVEMSEEAIGEMIERQFFSDTETGQN